MQGILFLRVDSLNHREPSAFQHQQPRHTSFAQRRITCNALRQAILDGRIDQTLSGYAPKLRDNGSFTFSTLIANTTSCHQSQTCLFLR
jgi:hypothetical protein